MSKLTILSIAGARRAIKFGLVVMLVSMLGLDLPYGSTTLDKAPQLAAGIPVFPWVSSPYNATFPSLYQSGTYVVLAVLFHNLLGPTTTGTVLATIQNLGSQTIVARASRNVTISASSDAAVKMLISGLEPDVRYTVSYYAVNATNPGIAISSTSVLDLTVAESSRLLGLEPMSMLGSTLCNVGCQITPAIMVTWNNTSPDPIPIAMAHGVTRQGSPSQVIANETLAVTLAAGESKTLPFYGGNLQPGVYELSTFITMQNGSALSGVSDVNFQILQNGSFFVGQAGAWTLTANPTPTVIGSHSIEEDYMNNLNFTVVGIV